MEYRRFGNAIIAGLTPGDEVMACIQEIAQKEQITLGKIEGIGAIRSFRIGLFDTDTKEYHVSEYRGQYEIISLLGNLSIMNGETYSHCHLAAADASNCVIGGHLNEAVISGVGELVITMLDGRLERGFSPEIGLNVYRFD